MLQDKATKSEIKKGFLRQLEDCIYEPGHEKTCLMSYANNKGADQPAHPRSLISSFVVRCLDSVMSLVSVTKISSIMLASVAEQSSLSLTWWETPEDMFSHDDAHVKVQFWYDTVHKEMEVCTIYIFSSLTVSNLWTKHAIANGPGHAKMSYAICEQQRRRSACASAQSDQHLCCSLLRWYDMYTCYIQFQDSS